MYILLDTRQSKLKLTVNAPSGFCRRYGHITTSGGMTQ